MKNLTTSFGRKLGLAAVILAAGFCYSCGLQGAPVPLMGNRGTVLAEAAVAGSDFTGGDAAAVPGRDSVAGAAGVSGSDAGAAAAAATGGAAEAGAAGVSGSNPMADESGAQKVPTAPEVMASDSVPAVCCVHVCGEVNAPGVYELEEGQRICEAIEQAGGFTEGAATDYLNLAEPVRDGMKLAVPNRDDIPKKEWAPEYTEYGAAGSRESGEIAGGAFGAAGLVNLNTATKEELMTLTGIGEARAEDILRYRQEHGRFERIEDVMKISGIKEAAFDKIRENITVSP
ncbi:MAG: helix-hairpin-helix domain-containing protein [Eubacteriales bacterium]|nr:helix-hairpin-helix domain-containing protein [Eubacteriales bacterium]